MKKPKVILQGGECVQLPHSWSKFSREGERCLDDNVVQRQDLALVSKEVGSVLDQCLGDTLKILDFMSLEVLEHFLKAFNEAIPLLACVRGR